MATTRRRQATALVQVDALLERVKSAKAAALGAFAGREAGPGQPWTWQLVEGSLAIVREQLRLAQSKVRGLALAEKRAACGHGRLRTFADGSARCVTCRQPFAKPEEASHA